MSERIHEEYIGDGAYVYISPEKNVVLYTSDGDNRVFLEPSVLKRFKEWLEQVEEILKT